MPLVQAKCENCGASLNVESDLKAAICPYCGGAYVVKDAINYYNSVTNIQQLHADVVNITGKSSEKTRQESIQEMNRIVAYFGQISDLYEKYDDCCQRYRKAQYLTSSGLFNTGLGISTIGVSILLASIFEPILNNAPISIKVIIGSVALMVPGILLIVFGIKSANKRLDIAYSEYQLLEEKIGIHYRNYGVCPIGIAYTKPYILKHIQGIIQSGRADTIKEAINRYENDLHNGRVIQQLAQIRSEIAYSETRNHSVL